jgi:hypothetical protein
MFTYILTLILTEDEATLEFETYESAVAYGKRLVESGYTISIEKAPK